MNRFEQQPCYEYRLLPPEQQVSVFPESPDWENVTYFLGFADDLLTPRVKTEHGRFTGRKEPSTALDRRVALPPGRCNGSCSNHGLCMAVADKQHKDQPYCVCYNVSACCCCCC